MDNTEGKNVEGLKDPVELSNTQGNEDSEIHKWGKDLGLGSKQVHNSNEKIATSSDSKHHEDRGDKGMDSASY